MLSLSYYNWPWFTLLALWDRLSAHENFNLLLYSNVLISIVLLLLLILV